MNYLLKKLSHHLNEYDIFVPKSVYHLKKEDPSYSSTICTYKDDTNGHISNISLSDTIIYALQKNIIKTCHNYIDLKINIDGMPLFKGSKISLWPILVMINDHDVPLPLGLFAGKGKPLIENLVGNLCSELRNIKEAGFNYAGKELQLGKILFIADAPARAYLQGINSHTGYRGCGYCTAEGEYIDHRVLYSYTNKIT